jgi:branched-chain amino acid transport system ATP-binding protein
VTGPAAESLLSLHDIRVRLSGLQILDGVSISVPQGTVTGLIGPNGAGKTTVFNVISGFVKPESGDVRYDGRIRKHIRAHRLTKMGISRTLQGVGLFASLSALENVMLGGSSRVRSGLVSQSLAMPWTDIETERLRTRALEGHDRARHCGGGRAPPGELPYPVQKKARPGLVCDPTLLLLDEPAGGVGAPDMEELERLIRSWCRKRTSCWSSTTWSWSCRCAT